MYLGDRKKTTMGRANSCTVRLTGERASRNHGHFQLSKKRSGTIQLVDTSTNGTHVNHVRMVKGVPRNMKHGAEIYVGDTHIATYHNQSLVLGATSEEEDASIP